MALISSKLMYIGVMSVIIIAVASYGLFFFFQRVNETSIRESIFEQELDRQINSTNSISQHISSNLLLVTSILQDLADSTYLQNEMTSGDKVAKFLEEKFNQLNSVTKVDGLLITDKEGIITNHIASRGLETFAINDILFSEYLNRTKENLLPIYSEGLTGIDGKYRILITFPIISVDDGHFIGTVAASLPTIEFFENYGNVNDINSQFLVAYDTKANLLVIGASSNLVGKNFFGNETQQFIKYNKDFNNLTNHLLAGKPGYAIYNYGKGERLNTQAPILVESKPVYFLQVVTPTDRIYLKINSVLFTEGVKMFSLLTGTTAAIIVLVFLLRKWYGILQDEVKKRTHDLNESNYKLMKANESLKTKDEAQKQFINIAAHELRTPIQPILNAISLLQSANLGQQKQNQYIDIIKRNTEKLGRLAEDILDVTRIESKSLKLTYEQFDLNDLIVNNIEEYKRNIHFIYEDLIVSHKGDNKSIFVKGDRMRLNQVLFNLLDNAGKFTKKGSITITTQVKSDMVNVIVKDTGIGIHPEIFPKLFTKFVTKSDRGTGLGLFIAKSIVQAHGGTIWAETGSEQKGATFIFTLPLSDFHSLKRSDKDEL